jgi:hypothetical protein
MHSIRLGALALLSLAATLILAAPAEARWRPSGSYESTCRNINFDGEVLTATCQRRDGSWRNTYLDDAGDCDDRITNQNGQLECGGDSWRGRHNGRYWDAPRGSYEDSCTNIRMDGYTLKATCQKRNGSWRFAWLNNAYDCDGRIANDNGKLVCRRWR